ncbi:HtaA domain-containing protein [Streptomyces sp. NPDC057386]|uniref:HtaA domain-containing protein n=1 Tax=unclassified Streptomyces TaxID=2593676 RepID=UPI00363AF7F9
MSATPRGRRSAVLAAAVTTAAALGAATLVTLGAGSASAAEVPLSGYELTWGIKQSYRTYVTTYAAGGFTATDGASQAAGNGAFTFTGGKGGYDSTAHTLKLGFDGSLRIVSEQHGFDITLSDVRFDSGAGAITADVTRSGTTEQDVPLAEVTVSRAMTDMATELTQQAADVFGSPSYAGAAGDPVTVAQKTTASPSTGTTASGSPSPTATASASAPASASPSATGPATGGASPSAPATGSAGAAPSATASPAPAKGMIADGTLGWGVKQSFRTYVVSGAAHGRVTTSGGATQAAGNGVFTFSGATGDYDTDRNTLTASFKGAVHFKGHESNGSYALDLTLSGLKVTLAGGSGQLTADVTSLGEKYGSVVLATLKAGKPDLTVDDDVIVVDGVRATLTEAGAKAFGGFYQAGAELDPVALRLALTDDAQLPGGTDGSASDGASSGGTGSAGGTGADTTGGTGSTTGGFGDTAGGVDGSLASTGSDLPVGALGTVAAAAVALGAGAVVAGVRRRRTAAQV